MHRNQLGRKLNTTVGCAGGETGPEGLGDRSAVRRLSLSERSTDRSGKLVRGIKYRMYLGKYMNYHWWE